MKETNLNINPELIPELVELEPELIGYYCLISAAAEVAANKVCKDSELSEEFRRLYHADKDALPKLIKKLSDAELTENPNLIISEQCLETARKAVVDQRQKALKMSKYEQEVFYSALKINIEELNRKRRKLEKLQTLVDSITIDNLSEEI
jgi:hypothetical protein